MEILQGIRDEKYFQSVNKLLNTLPLLQRQGLGSINYAIEIYRTCNARVKKVSKSIDTLIAVTALEYDIELFHVDKEFDVIAEYFPLKIYTF